MLYEDRQPSKSLNVLSSVQTIRSTLKSIIPTTHAFSNKQDEGPDSGQLHGSQVGYLIKKVGNVTEHLLKGWSVRKTIILATIIIVLYQLCTILICALQLDHIIE